MSQQLGTRTNKFPSFFSPNQDTLIINKLQMMESDFANISTENIEGTKDITYPETYSLDQSNITNVREKFNNNIKEFLFSKKEQKPAKTKDCSSQTDFLSFDDQYNDINLLNDPYQKEKIQQMLNQARALFEDCYTNYMNYQEDKQRTQPKISSQVNVFEAETEYFQLELQEKDAQIVSLQKNLKEKTSDCQKYREIAHQLEQNHLNSQQIMKSQNGKHLILNTKLLQYSKKAEEQQNFIKYFYLIHLKSQLEQQLNEKNKVIGDYEAMISNIRDVTQKLLNQMKSENDQMKTLLFKVLNEPLMSVKDIVFYNKQFESCRLI